MKWLLVKVNLFDYLSSLRKDFFDYDVQRRIEDNPYMDDLINTVISEEPLPDFNLVCNDDAISESDHKLDYKNQHIRTY